MKEPKEFEKDPCHKCPYQNIEDISLLIFRDRFYCIPAIESTYKFMDHMLSCHPEDLEFLHEKAQEYITIKDSQYRMDFPRWIKRVRRGLKTYKEQKEDKNG